MPFIYVEYQTPADDPTLFRPLTVPRYYKVESIPEAWEIAKHYKASNVKCDPNTFVVKELSEEDAKKLRAEGAEFRRMKF